MIIMIMIMIIMMMIRLRKTKSVASRSGWLSREGSRGNATRYDYLRPGIIRRPGINNLTIIIKIRIVINVTSVRQRDAREALLPEVRLMWWRRRARRCWRTTSWPTSRRDSYSEGFLMVASRCICTKSVNFAKVNNVNLMKYLAYIVGGCVQCSKSDLRTHCSQKSGDFVLFLFDGISVFIMPERQLCEICHFLQAHSIEKHTNLRWKKWKGHC